MAAISAREWRWVAGWAAAVMLLTCLPYLYGWWLSTPQMVFTGFFMGVEDANSYLAKMRQGAAGSWLFQLPFTPEPHPGVYLYTFHLLLGKLGAVAGVSPTITYHTARLTLGILALAVVYQFIARFTEHLTIRQLAFLLVSLGSGLGWLVITTGWVGRIGLPLDIYLPEGFNFLMLLHLPHLLLAELLLLGGLLLLIKAWQAPHRGWLWAVLAGGAFFLLASIAAFYVAVVTAVLGATLLLRFWRGRRWSWAETGLTLLAISPMLPIVFYNFWLFATIPVYQALWEQIVRSPSPLHYLLAYGLLLLLALPTLKTVWLNNQNDGLLLIAWVLVVPILVYLPFNLQRRLVLGVQVPLSILAAMGFFQIYGAKVSQWRWARTGLLFVASLTNIFLLVGGLITISAQQPPIFQPTSQAEAMRWLAQRANGEVVLAVYETGNRLPAYAHVRAFVGHGPETLHSDEKRVQANLFFRGSTSDAWRRDLLQQFDIKYVFYGPDEKAAGDFAPKDAAYLKEIYSREDIQIFQVEF